MFKKIISTVFVLGAFSSAYAENEGHEGPCKQIKESCEHAGFIKGEAKEGKGLWMDCIQPIMTGTPNPKSKMALPAIDPKIIEACKQKHHDFGTGHKDKK